MRHARRVAKHVDRGGDLCIYVAQNVLLDRPIAHVFKVAIVASDSASHRYARNFLYD